MIVLGSFLLIMVALVATIVATIAGLTGMDADFEFAAFLAVFCLAGALSLGHLDHALRRRMARGREQVWQRREHEGL